MATAKDIWDNLSKVDVSEHIEKKNNLSYLSWAWAWGTLMEHYPQATFEFREFARGDGTLTDILQYPINDTASVYCTVTIDEVSRSMWLPCMDYRNNAVPAPDARCISDTKMRCLVKCISMLGLGHYIYAGEDLPEKNDKGSEAKKEDPKPAKKEKKATEKKVAPEEGILNGFTVFAESCDTTEKLHDFWRANRDELTKLEKSHAEAYAKILAMFSEKKKELQEKNDTEGMEF